MRIGKFAALHSVTQDTIRHYQEMGLLVAEKVNGRYDFTDADSRDLEKILHLKELEFTLNEVKRCSYSSGSVAWAQVYIEISWRAC